MQEQNKNQAPRQGHYIDTLHNQDKVLKESISLFIGGSLEFLDTQISGKVTDILSTEITETTTKKAYADNALKLDTNEGLHIEGEVHISKDDMVRFASYNLDLAQQHKIDFTTVIITTNKPSVKGYKSRSISFTPIIINLKERDADEVLAEVDRRLQVGEDIGISELHLIYLPLYGSKSGKTTAELLDKAIKLTPLVAKDNVARQRKLHSLIILLTGTFVSNDEMNRVLEANMINMETNSAVVVLEKMGAKRRESEIACKHAS